MKAIFHIFLLILTFFLLANGQLVVEASSKALILWFEALIPSMFVSMVLLKTCISLKCFDILLTPFKGFIHILFHMDKSSFTLVLVSLTIGFPAFAIMVDELVDKRQLSIREGQRLIYCCSCASISFILMSLGIACFHSIKIGLVLYLIQVISVFILLFLTRKVEITCDMLYEETTFFQALSAAIFSSVKTMVIIVSYLMIALSLVAISSRLLPVHIADNLRILSEFSSGSITIATSTLPKNSQLLLIGALLSFGGFCVHLQVQGSCTHTSLNILTYFNYRLFQVMITMLLTFLFIQWMF